MINFYFNTGKPAAAAALHLLQSAGVIVKKEKVLNFYWMLNDALIERDQLVSNFVGHRKQTGR